MKRSRRGSRIEVWDRDYINHPERREEPRDRTAVIVQIEPCLESDDYMVEVIER